MKCFYFTQTRKLGSASIAVLLPTTDDSNYRNCLPDDIAVSPFSMPRLIAASDTLAQPSAEGIEDSSDVFYDLMGPRWFSTVSMNFTLGYETLTTLARNPDIWPRTWPTEFEKDSLCELAARRGELALLHQAFYSGCPLGPEVCYWAAHGGHLHVLDWFTDKLTERPMADKDAMASLSRPGRVHHVLDWTSWRETSRCPPRDTAEAWLGAAHANRPEVMKWMSERWIWWQNVWLDGTGAACARAAAAGQLEVLQTLRANGAPWNSTALAGAEANGHAAVAAWLRANGAPTEPETEASQHAKAVAKLFASLKRPG